LLFSSFIVSFRFVPFFLKVSLPALIKQATGLTNTATTTHTHTHTQTTIHNLSPLPSHMDGRRIIDSTFEQENAAILSTFYPIGSTSPTTATATATITTATTTKNTMEPSELTKRLLMNRPPPKPLQNDQAVSSISAGQTSAVAAAQQQRHNNHHPHPHPHHHKYHNEEEQDVEHHDDRSQASSSAAAPGAAPHSPHPTSAALIQAAAAAAASSVAAATSSSLNDMVEQEKQSRRRKDFPWKLHCMLEEADTFNNQHIVSWMPDGRSFRVFLPDEFVSRIMPHYFHQTQYRSFQRMLNLYDFAKVVTGPNRGAYSHPMFIRSDRNLCLQMRIRKRSTSKKSKKTTKAAPAENRAAATRGGGRAAAESNQAVYPLLTSFQEAQQQQNNQNFTAPGVDMEGLYPMFQQPMLQQYDQHQYQQQSHLQPFQFQSLGQLEQQHDESPLTSRQIYTLDPNNFQGRIMNQDPSASTRTASNTPPTHGISPATWKNAILQRSLLSTNPTSDDQRVNLSPPSLGMMDRLVRGRTDYGVNQDESKSSSSVHYETKVRQKSSHIVQNQPAFQLPLHFDLEPTPLPPHERSNM